MLKGDNYPMANYDMLKAKVQELAERDWDLSSIETRYNALIAEGIPKRRLDRENASADKIQILDRVQQRGEENNYLLKNCATSTALAVMEEFGLGNMEIIKALSPFPGFGGTGWMCGGVTGGLIALGLYFGSDDPMNFEAMGSAIMAARKFMPRFEEQVGSVLCPKIHEDVVFGYYIDIAASPENMERFAKEKGFEKCTLLPGIGARIASEIILESFE
jgi:C_GCAxxG_C_C family probable redox protein